MTARRISVDPARALAARPGLAVALASLAALGLAGCGEPYTTKTGPSSFDVTIVSVNGADPPPATAPLPANVGTTDDRWEFAIQAVDGQGAEVDFDGYARIRVEPGSVTGVESEGAAGRNVLFTNGKAAGTAFITAVYGPTRLWVEDMGYVPAPPGATPRCADGTDDDGDGPIDYPADPGCAFADDDTEEGGTFAAAVSPPVHYGLPRVADVQGTGTETPYPFEGIQIHTDDPQVVVVTRVSSDGFYVTDLTGPEGGSNSLFAFNFNTPPGMRVCDRLVYLSGTVVEFFGFTEISFPSYDVTFPKEGEGECLVPEPTVLTNEILLDDVVMESLESSLVRLEGYTIASFFGPKNPEKSVMCDYGWCFAADASSCDLNGDGQVDFENPEEADCGDVCSDNPECSEWTSFSARGNFKVSKGNSQMQIQTSSVAGFDPPSFRGKTITAVTGTMRNFSGGSLNWTVETRCPDDLACDFSDACVAEPISSEKACVRLRTTDDPDEATN